MGGSCTTCRGPKEVRADNPVWMSIQLEKNNLCTDESKAPNGLQVQVKLDEVNKHEQERKKSFPTTNGLAAFGRIIQRKKAGLSTPLILLPELNHAVVSPSSFVSMDFVQDLMDIAESGAQHGWEGLFSSVRGLCHNVTGAQTANLFVIAESNKHLVTIFESSEVWFPLEPNGEIKRVIDERKVLKRKQPSKEFQDWRTVDGTHCNSVCNYICMPLSFSPSGDVVGILELYSSTLEDSASSGKPRQSGCTLDCQQTEEILSTVARMTAVSLNHMFRAEHDLSNMSRMQVQVEASQQLSNVVGLRGLFQVVQHQLLNIIGFEAVNLYVYDEHETTIWTNLTHLGEVVIGLQEKSVLAHVFDSGENLLLTQASSHPDFNESVDSPDGILVRDMAVLPIMNPKRPGNCIGLLQVCNKREDWCELRREAVVSEEDMMMLDSLGLHLASALQTAIADQNLQADVSVYDFYGTSSVVRRSRIETMPSPGRRSNLSIISTSSTAFSTSHTEEVDDLTKRKGSAPYVRRTYSGASESEEAQLTPRSAPDPRKRSLELSSIAIRMSSGRSSLMEICQAPNKFTPREFWEQESTPSKENPNDPCENGENLQEVQENPNGNLDEDPPTKRHTSCICSEVYVQADDHSGVDIVFHPNTVSSCLGMEEVEDSAFADLNIEDPGLNLLSFTPSQLNTIVLAMFQAFDLPRVFNIPTPKLERFIERVAMNYQAGNQFHNWTHAVTVLHVVFVSLIAIKDINCFMSLLDVLALFVGALAHDVDHTGQNNTFHIQSASTLALRYNDRSVLEAHSASTLYNLITDPDINILAGLCKHDYSTVRVLVLNMILETDLAAHDPLLSRLMGHSNFAFDRKAIEDRKLVTSVILHAADLSNPTRPFDQAYKWAHLLAQEMMTQVKLEKSKNMLVAPFMEGLDDVVKSAKGEIFFISTFSQPLWDAVAEIFPGLRYRAEMLQENLDAYARLVEKHTGEAVKMKKRNISFSSSINEDEVSVANSLPGTQAGNRSSVTRIKGYRQSQRYSMTRPLLMRRGRAFSTNTSNWLRRSVLKGDVKEISQSLQWGGAGTGRVQEEEEPSPRSPLSVTVGRRKCDTLSALY